MFNGNLLMLAIQKQAVKRKLELSVKHLQLGQMARTPLVILKVINS